MYKIKLKGKYWFDFMTYDSISDEIGNSMEIDLSLKIVQHDLQNLQMKLNIQKLTYTNNLIGKVEVSKEILEAENNCIVEFLKEKFLEVGFPKLENYFDDIGRQKCLLKYPEIKSIFVCDYKYIQLKDDVVFHLEQKGFESRVIEKLNKDILLFNPIEGGEACFGLVVDKNKYYLPEKVYKEMPELFKGYIDNKNKEYSFDLEE